MASKLWRKVKRLISRRKEEERVRVFAINGGEENEIEGFAGNSISTTKYKWYTFLPRGLFEQFRRVANLYFLFHAALSFTPLSPVSPITTVLPLVFVVGMAMIKELFEDIQRGKSDWETNRRKVEVLGQDGQFHVSKWRDVQVGHIVRVLDGSFFPADLLCLATSITDGSCFVETLNLDGETNLKLRKALHETQGMEQAELGRVRGSVECECPNLSLYTFAGKLKLEGLNSTDIFLQPSQILLRGSKLRNTEWIMGVAVYTGRETKIMMNATDPPSKRSFIEQRLDFIILFQLFLLFLFSAITSIGYGILLNASITQKWYLAPNDFYGITGLSMAQYNPEQPALAGFLQIFTSLILYGYFVPISLYVTLEVVRLFQAAFIRRDLHLYYEDKDIPIDVRTSNLNDELGMVKTVLTDKTGTLTRNQMEFFKCSIAGVVYGKGVTEVQKAAAEIAGKAIPEFVEEEEEDEGVFVPEQPLEKGFNLKDPRLEGMKWVGGPHASHIRRFLEILAVCQTVVTGDSGGVVPGMSEVQYMAESPDEAAFVVAAKRIGFFFWGRQGERVMVREYGPGWTVVADRAYDLLNTLAFTSHRKRMSVVVRDPEGRLLLLTKGADSVILARLGSSDEAQQFLKVTEEQMTVFAEAGLRTLALAYKEIKEEEYSAWQAKWMEARSHVEDAGEQAEKLEALAEELEQNLILIGATAIEDKLQVGVPQAIEKLAKAGIKVWVLTGDKLETAINIGYACNLLRHEMQQHLIFLEDNEEVLKRAIKSGQDLEEYSKERICAQVFDAKAALDNGSSHAIIIDGKALALVLEDKQVQNCFLDVALRCESVVCCRVSPKQKAQVTMMVRKEGRQICLSVGDGANDVGMIQKANIGVGIAGEEGQQAVMAADFAIGQFRFLERLMLVHGGWCYNRIAYMIKYFFFKSLAFGFTIIPFNFMALFSGSSIYYEWYLSLYQVIFTSIPIGVVAIMDQDVKAIYRMRFPGLYLQGQNNVLFSWTKILGWMLSGVYMAAIIYVMDLFPYSAVAVVSSGRVWDMTAVGTVMYTSMVIAINLELLVTVQYLTWIHHVAVWGSILVWFLFVAVGSYLPISFVKSLSRIVTQVFVAPGFYFTVLLAVVAAMLPGLCVRAAIRRFWPFDYQIVQEIAKQESRRRQSMRPSAYTNAAADSAVSRHDSVSANGSSTHSHSHSHSHSGT